MCRAPPPVASGCLLWPLALAQPTGDGLDVSGAVRAYWLHVEDGDTRSPVGGDPVSHEPFVPDERHPGNKLGRDHGRRGVLVAGQIRVLDLLSLFLEAVALEHVVVEVTAACA